MPIPRTIDEFHDDFDFGEDEDVKEIIEATVVEFMFVQPKSLQNCKITYEDAVQSLSQVHKIKLEDEAEEPAKIKVEEDFVYFDSQYRNSNFRSRNLRCRSKLSEMEISFRKLQTR